MWDNFLTEAHMNERRGASRRPTDMTVSKHVDGEIYFCRACEISPTGIRLERIFNPDPGDRPINIELPLVEGGLTTVLAARKVWRKGDFEAFEFMKPSFAQQSILEQLFGNY
jgi:hypothetical protein